jgi:hypothetical protein
MRVIVALIPVCFLTSCNTPEPPGHAGEPNGASNSKPQPVTTLAGFQSASERFNSVIGLPELEKTPADVRRSVSSAIDRASAAMDAIASCRHDKLTFGNTVAALDDISYDLGLTANRLALIKDTSTNSVLRDAATE